MTFELFKHFRTVHSQYRDLRDHRSDLQLQELLENSVTIYVGNLSFYTTEEQIYELFSKCGEIKRIIMGLDRYKKTPCGFCFVEYYTHEDAFDCINYINGTRLDDRCIRTDWDVGFKDPSRRFGRGRSGGQVRDEYRTDDDPGRGGYGKETQKELERLEYQRAALAQYYEAITEVPYGVPMYSSAYAGLPNHLKYSQRDGSGGGREAIGKPYGPTVHPIPFQHGYGFPTDGKKRYRPNYYEEDKEGYGKRRRGEDDSEKKPKDDKEGEEKNPRFRDESHDTDEEK